VKTTIKWQSQWKLFQIQPESNQNQANPAHHLPISLQILTHMEILMLNNSNNNTKINNSFSRINMDNINNPFKLQRFNCNLTKLHMWFKRSLTFFHHINNHNKLSNKYLQMWTHIQILLMWRWYSQISKPLFNCQILITPHINNLSNSNNSNKISKQAIAHWKNLT